MVSGAKIHSKYHPDRRCSACLLCSKSSSAEEKEFLNRYWDGKVRDDSLHLCCSLKRSQMHEYTTKWGNKVSVTQKEHQVCMYPSCTANNKLIAPYFVPINELKAALQVHSVLKYKNCVPSITKNYTGI